ncbi:hypothetical protein [Rhizobium sp. P44RR-XXIV]|uniref:hypothetical protein n=1 Tax=Rhizobium sp. P44RR-XXIV TaxID=1921145 RepID=UPI0009872515|nr:hypothetical protein [Rhizobium sp. P44RR-XXIV]TIX90175.1 hypothetical protein BSK43_012740 [Rhizobium sp. P44RR-XXIV]
MQIQSVSTSPTSNSLISANDEIKKQRQDPSQILLSSSSDARSRALSKIEDAKQELDFLKRYGFPPQVIARIAGELARSVGAAAQQFSQAIGAAGASSTAPSAPVADAAASAEAGTVASDDTESNATKDAGTTNDGQTNDGKTDGPDGVEAKQAKLAYHAMAEDGGTGSGFSSDDQKIVDQFNAILAEIKALLDKAKRDMQADKQAASQTASAGSGDDTMMQPPAGSAGSTALFI